MHLSSIKLHSLIFFVLAGLCVGCEYLPDTSRPENIPSPASDAEQQARQASADREAWLAAKQANTAEAYENYLNEQPAGVYRTDAQNQLEQLRQQSLISEKLSSIEASRRKEFIKDFVEVRDTNPRSQMAQADYASGTASVVIKRIQQSFLNWDDDSLSVSRAPGRYIPFYKEDAWVALRIVPQGGGVPLDFGLAGMSDAERGEVRQLWPDQLMQAESELADEPTWTVLFENHPDAPAKLRGLELENERFLSPFLGQEFVVVHFIEAFSDLNRLDQLLDEKLQWIGPADKQSQIPSRMKLLRFRMPESMWHYRTRSQEWTKWSIPSEAPPDGGTLQIKYVGTIESPMPSSSDNGWVQQ